MHKYFAIIFAVFLNLNSIASAREVTVSGECIGVKVYTAGLVVTDTVTLTDTDGKKVNPSQKSDIKKGDIIKKVNGAECLNAKAVSAAVENGKEITLTVLRENKCFDTAITPVQTTDGLKLGLWLRDSTAGLGTITCFYNNDFYALGHGICDVDTGTIMPVRHGIIQECTSFEIEKGRHGSPGAITGSISGTELGEITDNTAHGLIGTMQTPIDGTEYVTAEKKEIAPGKATILCDVDGSGISEYEIKIKQLFPYASAGKDMIIEITDKELIKKTGGIVQGMSGSPIIQNGKLVGAVTHVFVNNPKKGYGIFIDNMLAKAENK